MASIRNILRALRLPRKLQLPLVVAVSFYAIGFISGRAKYMEVTVDTSDQANYTEKVEITEQVVKEEERCIRNFIEKYRELCHQTMFGY